MPKQVKMGDVSDKNDSRPSLETEAISGDESYDASFEGEVKLDLSLLSSDILNPPNIPNTLGAADIDKVIEALSNVPDVKISESPKKNRQKSASKKRPLSDDDDGYYDEEDLYRRRRSSHDRDDEPTLRRIPIGVLRARTRGRLRIRARGSRGRGYILEQARGLFGGRRASRTSAATVNSRGAADLGRGVFPVARGRNIFPEDEPADLLRARGRFITRENALFKRFKQQHRLEQEEDEYNERQTRSRSRSRSKSASSSSRSTSDSSSSGSDSDSSHKKRKKKKEKDKKKKKKSSEKKKKKKRNKDGKYSSEEDTQEDWRISLLQKMKNIKNLPPEQLEVEFKKAMAEKRKKEDEEECMRQIKHRQKLARKVKKESEKAAKKATKEEKKKKEKGDATENSFYAGFSAAMVKSEAEGDRRVKSEFQPVEPVVYPIFKSSFAEVPFEPELGDNAMDGQDEGAEEEMDPYARALEEHMKNKKKLENTDDVCWPAGALEEAGLEEQAELTREQMDLLQEQERQALDDRTKTVVTASKMFSKIRNRIKSKPLKINLKMHSKPAEEEPGLQPHTGENTPGEGPSDGERDETWYDEDLTEYDFRGSEDMDLERRMERMRRKKEVHDPGELEDGEHSPSPEPVRPHLRRRMRQQQQERRDGTPLLDEKVVVEQLEEGEIDNDAPVGGSPVREHRSWKPPPPPIGAAMSFLDTSIPPPSMIAVSLGSYGGVRPPTFANPATPAFNPQSQLPPMYDTFAGPPPGFPAIVLPAIPPPVPIFNPELIRPTSGRPALLGAPPPIPAIVDPYAKPSREFESAYSRASERDRYGRRYEDSDRREDRYDRSRDRYDRRDTYDDRRDSYDRRAHQRSADRSDDYEYSDRRRGGRKYREDSDEEQGREEDGSIDITKITPIMKYIAKNLEDSKYQLELRGPFQYNDDSPGLSKHLFVAYRMVDILEKAGYDQSKMYMQAMFPQGMGDTKTEMIEKATRGKLHPEIHGPKLVKMCVRCIKGFIAYFSGKKDDIDSSEDEDAADGGGARGTKTVSTSLSAILGRIKEESMNGGLKEESDPLSRVLETRYESKPAFPDIPDSIDNHWGSMDTQIKADHLKSFNALQNHFAKQLISKAMDPRDAREESADCMMCLVVTGWSDSMLRDMVTRFKKTILPEQSQLEDKRRGSDRTLFDQMVDLMIKHEADFPWAIIQTIQRDDDPKTALLKRVRNIVERMLKFYMRGCGKLQEGREESTTKLNAPGDYQFNYIPDGLREDEEMNASHHTTTPKAGLSNNFFNMEAAAVANRSFSTYNKRLSQEEEPGLDLEPVSPDNGEIIKGCLPKKKYLFGTLHIDILQFRGSDYVYEIGLYMSDTSSCEVSIVPTNLYKERTALEMLGFSYTPEEGKFIYVKPGVGFQKTFGESQGLDKVLQFLKEKRYESKGESKNAGLVLATQTTSELATWEKFTRFHKVDMELDNIVAGYGVLDLFIEDSLGKYSYVGPKMNRESNKTFFTWEFCRLGRTSENMAGTKAGSIFKILEDLLESSPDYENFIRQNCFHPEDSRFNEVRRKEDIMKDLYNLECYLSDALNERNLRKNIFTGGVFSAASTADLGDRSGLVASRFIRFLVESGLSKPALKDRAVECRERGTEFLLPMEKVLKRMRKQEEKERCREQMQTLTRVVEKFILTK